MSATSTPAAAKRYCLVRFRQLPPDDFAIQFAAHRITLEEMVPEINHRPGLFGILDLEQPEGQQVIAMFRQPVIFRTPPVVASRSANRGRGLQRIMVNPITRERIEDYISRFPTEGICEPPAEEYTAETIGLTRYLIPGRR